MKTFSAILLLLILSWPSNRLLAKEPIDVSLIQLIANPSDYDGKIVRVIGFLRMEFEGNSMYMHEDDYRKGITRNGLWIDVTSDMRNRDASLNLKYVLLEGKFNAEDKGHLGLWSGSITNIVRAEAWNAGE